MLVMPRYAALCRDVRHSTLQPFNMPPIQERRKRFKAALDALESTQAAFCRQHRISQGHLLRILTGERTSPRIEREIERVIAEGATRVTADTDAANATAAA